MAAYNDTQFSRARSGIPQQYSVPIDLRQRPIPSVPEPARNKPTESEFYIQDSHGVVQPNHTFLKDHFFREGRLTEEQALFILGRTTKVLSMEPNLVDVKSPVTICGDIHGQYYDLMKLFDVGGNIDENNYLFLGDYVDRGCFGIECLLYLYTLKLWYPEKVVLLRGNHECRHLTEYFTFKRECLHKYSSRVYEACIESFCALPITALVDGRFFCVHGGISPSLIQLSDLNNINRFTEPGNDGLLCDLLWCDPIANYGHENEPSSHGPGLAPGTLFLPNSTRGCSFYFTYEASCKFLERNGLLGIIRGHEAQDAGYTMHRKTPTKKFPSVITIFSAPNYLDFYHNRGAVLKYANKNITIRQYNSSSHPYWLPNFSNAFTWSLPFVGAKITEMLLAVLSVCSEEELSDADADSTEGTEVLTGPAPTPEEIRRRRQEIKNKILAVGKMQRVYTILRQETENATELAVGEVTNGAGSSVNRGLGDIRPNELGVQGTKLVRSIKSFDDARRLDMQNERLPEFNPDIPQMMSGPSMRRGSADSGMELLIKKTLEEEGDEGGVVERIAEKIARGRRITERPSALKRHGTA